MYETTAQAVAALKENRKLEGEEAEEAEEELSDQDDDLATDDETELESEDQPEPSNDPPVGWSEDEKETFHMLTPTAQDAVLRMERERDGLLSQKSQKLSEELKNVQRERELVNEDKERAKAILAREIANAPKPPDKELLNPDSEKHDESEYLRQKADFDEKSEQVREAEGELQKIQAEETKELQGQLQEWQTTQRSTYAEKLPELLDQEKGPVLQQKLFAYAESAGLNRTAVSAASAAEIIVLNNSRLFEEARGKDLKKVRKASPSQRPGSPKPQSSIGKAKVDKLRARAKTSGSLKDQLALLKATRGT